MNDVTQVENLKKLSIEKKTIRNLTAEEVEDVGGGISIIVASSTLCVEAITIAVSAAVC